MLNDPHLRVEVLGKYHFPDAISWQAMHQDYSEGFVADEAVPNAPGTKVVKHLLAGKRGHYGPLEHAHITFNVGGFPHSVMQQARTHRVGISFDVQSMRYTGNRICDVAHGIKSVEEVFFLRPVGDYPSRDNGTFSYTAEMREADLAACARSALDYMYRVSHGMSYEQARGVLVFDFRQNFVVTFNIRSLMHFLDMRWKRDAQAEIQTLCDLIYPHFHTWTPEVAEWYESSRKHKASLAP